MYLTQGLRRAVQQQPDEVMTIFGRSTGTGATARSTERGGNVFYMA
jgi:hypothetical protein